jgi:hypothetical protein
MTEQNTVIERITTVEDGEGTVNERLSTGGPGPEGQLDTVTESLSGQGDAPVAAPEPEDEPSDEVDEEPKPAKKAAAKKTAAKKS